MKTHLVLSSLALAFTLAGCASAQITKRTYSPQKGGIAKYSNDMIMGSKNREEANKQMREVCGGGDFNITAESTGNEMGPIQSTRDASGQMQINQTQQTFTYLEFVCK